MSAIFPRHAVVERYLHGSGRRGSVRKVVLAFLAGAACAVAIANVPAGWLKTSDDAAPAAKTSDNATTAAAARTPTAKLAAETACKERTWPYNRCVEPAPPRTAEPAAPPPPAPTRVIPIDRTASLPPAPAPEETARAGTTGQAARETNVAPPRTVTPPPANAVAAAPTAAPQPDLTPAPAVQPVQTITAHGAAPAPAPQALAAHAPPPAAQAPAPPAPAAPAPAPAAQAPAPPAPAADSAGAATSPREPAKAATAAGAPDQSARKPAPKKVKAAKRKGEPRLGRRPDPNEAVPTLVRVHTLPDGTRVYQRVREGDLAAGYNGSTMRRVYLAPADGAVD